MIITYVVGKLILANAQAEINYLKVRCEPRCQNIDPMIEEMSRIGSVAE